MTNESIKNFIREVYSKTPKKIYATNKTDFYQIDEIWSSDILDYKKYGPENKRGYRYVSIVIDNFGKFGCYIPLKTKNPQTIKDSLEKLLIYSKKPNLIKIDRGKEFYNSIFQNLLNTNNIKPFPKITH